MPSNIEPRDKYDACDYSSSTNEPRRSLLIPTIRAAVFENSMLRFAINQKRLLKPAIPLFLIASVGSAQENLSQRPTSQQPEDVVRISTELVQTGVTVLDKQSRVIDGLQREQFELSVNGKPRPITFFDSVAAGSSKEETLSKIAGSGSGASVSVKRTSDTTEPGRSVFFFVDDLHLAANNFSRTRQSVLYFVNELMARNDQAAIVSASGQIGFLQQLTSHKSVLRAAAERLKPMPSMTRDSDRPPISEYAALMIIEQHDRDLVNYFVEQTMKVNRMDESERPIAASMVQSRARLTLKQSDAASKDTLLTLESLIHSAARLPGRKIVFFLSDGFVLNLTGSDIAETMRRLTDEAVRANAVIYTIDARGLSTDSRLDASNGGGSDTTGVLSRALSSEQTFTQEGLYALAADTGGRALLNSNSLNSGIDRALRETAVYYVLAWRPDNPAQRDNKFHSMEVKVTGRPDLKVLVQRGYFSAPIEPKVKELPGLSSSTSTHKRIPITLALWYEPTAGNRMLLSASIKVDMLAVPRHAPPTSQDVDMEFMGAVMDTRGKVVGSFMKRVNIKLFYSKSESTEPTFKYLLRVAPGLYQVRVAVIDPLTKELGDAANWIELPTP